MVKNILIIQARINSKRLYNKVFLKIDKNLSFLDLLLRRIKKVKNLDKIILAVPFKDKNEFKKKKFNSVELFSGPERNVLKRFFIIANNYKPENIIRITSDCPFVDPKLINKLLSMHINLKNDFSCTDPNSFPDGQDIEIFTFKSFQKVFKMAKKNYDKEHVTTMYYKKNNIFKKFFLKSKKNYSNIRITLDYYSDLIFLKKIFKSLKKKYYFSLNDILKTVAQVKKT